MPIYESFVGNVDPNGVVAITFWPPIEVTQAMVNEALGSDVNRVTLGGELMAARHRSRYNFAVAGTDAAETSFSGLSVRMRELGARICWLASAEDEGPESRQALVEGFQAAPLIDLVIERQ